MKRSLALLLIFLSAAMLFSCTDSGNDRGEKTDVVFYDVDEADVRYISDAFSLNTADSERLCLLLKNAGLQGGINAVMRYTDGITGQIFYRVHTDVNAVDVYFYSDGSVKMKNGEKTCLFAASDVMIDLSLSAPTDTADVTADAVSGDTDLPADTSGMIAFIVNKSSGKYHRPDCRGVGTMSEENKMTVYVKNESELLAKGYVPCGICAEN